jgi:hypothetical protein
VEAGTLALLLLLLLLMMMTMMHCWLNQMNLVVPLAAAGALGAQPY